MAQKSDREKGEGRGERETDRQAGRQTWRETDRQRETHRERAELWNRDYWIKGEENGLRVTDFRPCATTDEVQHGGGGH